MKKLTKLLSVLLAVLLVIGTVPAASASAIPSSTGTVEKLISIDSINNLLEYLVTNFNDRKDDLVPALLRLLFMSAANEQINGYITRIAGYKDVSLLNGNEASKVLVKWLDEDILPPLQDKLNDTDVIKIINDNIPGLQIKIGSVQDVFDTLKQLDNLGLVLSALGDAKDINVTAIKNAPAVKGNEFTAVKAVIQFLKDNLGIVKKVLNGNLNLGIDALTDLVKGYIAFLKDLPTLVKSYLYKLIDSDAGEFAEGKMGGDWANSFYKDYSADQLLAAALIKSIEGYEGIVSKEDANALLGRSIYEILGMYAPALFDRLFAPTLNGIIMTLPDMLEGTAARAQFASYFRELTSADFSGVFSAAASTGLLAQANNFIVSLMSKVLSYGAFSSLGLVSGDNTHLNENLTKISRWLLNLMVQNEYVFGYSYPADVRNGISSMALPDLILWIVKPIVIAEFEPDESLLAAADSLPDLCVTLIYSIATNPDFLNLVYEFPRVTASTLNSLNNDPVKAADLITETLAGVAIGALKYNADMIHFTANVYGMEWNAAFDTIVNWALDLFGGVPAAARTHNLKNQNGYGGFYKLNVLMNEYLNLTFLNDASSVTFRTDLGVLVKDGLLENLMEGDFAGLLGVFERNGRSENPLNGTLTPTLINGLNKVLTALFEHSENRVTAEITAPAEGSKQCTHEIVTVYDYCEVCGAFYAAPERREVKLTRDLHVWETKGTTTNENGTPDMARCKFVVTKTLECIKCHQTKNEVSYPAHQSIQNRTEGHYEIRYCADCGYEIRRTYNENHVPGEPVETERTEPTCIDTGSRTLVTYCTLCGQEISRETQVLPKTGHTPGAPEEIVITEPTCIDTGLRALVTSCAVCGEELSRKTEVIPQTGHTPGAPVTLTVVEPTCTASGSYAVITFCTVCREELSYKGYRLEPIGHDFGEWTVTVQATCTENGEQKRTCPRCGTAETESIPAPGHAYGDPIVTLEPTCTANGIGTAACARCGLSETVSLPALGHDFGETVITTVPTCSATGTGTSTCARCKQTLNVTIPALGHSFGGWTTVTTPTCTAPGMQISVCARCGVSGNIEIPATGHSFGGWTVVSEPDCTEDGFKYRVCGVCRTREEVTLEALGHVEVAVAAAAPTCTQTGLTEGKRCAVCQFWIVPQITVSALGHAEVTDAGVAATCTKAGISEGKHCSRCSGVLVPQAPVAALGHDFDDTIEANVTTVASCTENGSKTVKCSRCDATEVTELPALGHDFSDWTEAKAPTCTVNGTQTRTCARCKTIESSATAPIGHAYGDWTKLDDDQHARICAHDGSHIIKENHKWNDGEITKPATLFEAGEKAFTCTVCGAKKAESLNKLKGTATATDTGSGISVTYDGSAYPQKITLRVTVTDTPEGALPADYEKTYSVNIATFIGSREVEPTAPVTVTVSVPEGFKADALAVYHVKDDGTVEKIDFTVKNGKITFTAFVFSVYVIADTASETRPGNAVPGDVDSDGNVSAADARLALRASVKLETFWDKPDEAKFKASDADKDGKISASDARRILRVAVKLETL